MLVTCSSMLFAAYAASQLIWRLGRVSAPVSPAIAVAV